VFFEFGFFEDLGAEEAGMRARRGEVGELGSGFGGRIEREGG
jgi:hypothetical protein